MKSDIDIALNQFRLYKERFQDIIKECRGVVQTNKKLYENGLINFNPTEKLEELIKSYDASN